MTITDIFPFLSDNRFFLRKKDRGGVYLRLLSELLSVFSIKNGISFPFFQTLKSKKTHYGVFFVILPVQPYSLICHTHPSHTAQKLTELICPETDIEGRKK